MLSPGVRLGRYEVLSPLGAGGMGEVYRARDTELDRRVALKVLPEDVAGDPDRLKRFEREARATAALSHPNVLTVFDVGCQDGRAFLVFELLEGSTLGTRLVRGPLSAPEAVAYAVQIARGLAAAHARGIVHRDLKPENLFVTTAGVVKVLDFGLARVQPSGERATTASDVTGPGTVMGTVSYMAPEQAKGHPGDARSDIFALGTVLYEMLSGQHPFRRDSSAETLTAILRDEPKGLGTLAEAGPTAVERLVLRCLEKRPEDRFQTANDLALALEAVAGCEDHRGRPSAVESVEERPYPGLSSFTEADAAQFFGREAEIAALWEKLRRQARLALIGPSGVGKTSFLRAGLIPQRPGGWGALYLTPGAGPVGSLARALTAPLASDPEAMADLVQGATAVDPIAGDARLLSAVSRWRQKTSEALLVMDQFEELFTLNPKETQDRFAGLLGRMADEADVHVLLSMRDDFLFRCTEQPALSAVFDSLTPLTPPSSAALRRALVEPAARLGVRFEDEALVAEMVATVEKERGALPLLAFAVSRLWDERDRERQILTRAAYERIGGVAGALAQHAEATLQAVGPAQEAVVREIFRNLVTAEGTRAARQREELLSVFAEQEVQAGAVLDALVSARLLTGYERPGEEGKESRQEVEVIHESLLANWPRLVRWQTQDADGAQLRDQLRQAAQVWQDRGRPEDLLWSGTAYQDFALWRARYPGGLSATEEAFAEAATRRAGRRRRQRRIAVAAVVATLSLGLSVVATFWGRAETSRQKAEAETLRAEASKLVALGQLELDTFPTAAVAYALKSLELADTGEVRLFALRALQRGPTARLTPILPADNGAITTPAFSPSGEWLALGGWKAIDVFRRDGSGPQRFGNDYLEGTQAVGARFGPRSDVLVANRQGDIRVFSVPDGRMLRRDTFERGPSLLSTSGESFVTATKVGERWILRRTPTGDGESHLIGTLEPVADFDIAGPSLAFARGRSLYLRSLGDWARPPRLLATHPADVHRVGLSPQGERVVTIDEAGDIRVWPATSRSARPLCVVRSKGAKMAFLDPSGRSLGGITNEGGRAVVLVWDLEAPPGAEPLKLRRNDYWSQYANLASFDPSGRWLAAAHGGDASLWRLEEGHPRVLAGHEDGVMSLAFTPDGTKLISAGNGGAVHLWSLNRTGESESRILLRTALFFPFVGVDSTSSNAIVGAGGGRYLIAPLAGGSPRELERLFKPDTGGPIMAVGDGGRLLASGNYGGPLEDRVIKVMDLATGAVRTLPRVRGTFEAPKETFRWLQFLDTNRLLASVTTRGLLLYDLRENTGRLVAPYPRAQFAVSIDGRIGVGLTAEVEDGFETAEVIRFTLDAAPAQTLTSHGTKIKAVALDPSGTLVATSSFDGTVRVGPVSGGEPHVFFGHEGQVWTIAFSPDGRWLATGGTDRTIRLWPVPDTSKPPPHAWDHNRFLDMLRAQTNLRAVPDPQSVTGWKIDRGPFPGWAKAPDR